VGVLHRSLREVQDVVNRSMRLVFRHEKVQELGACKRRHDRRRRKPTVGHTMIPAQMWRSPGADVAQSRCRCGAVPVERRICDSESEEIGGCKQNLPGFHLAVTSSCSTYLQQANRAMQLALFTVLYLKAVHRNKKT